ncbi:MAG: heme exporter protein CcmD [Gammaproteobacteria bacterium RIFCSPHIGHO2_12_FULL_45_9]|nr:MAG: heme exporter protein CcmD [Gammaproteobacteria bacterium RIFCSPHIGHO2_12_FULL_45_9]
MMHTHFWSMGGYAAFVWGAYGVFIGLCSGIWVSVWRRVRRLEKQQDES